MPEVEQINTAKNSMFDVFLKITRRALACEN